MFYRLNEDHSVSPCDTLAGFYESDRIIDQTQIGRALVSTVFLVIDHQYSDGEPLLFETMIFGGKLDSYQTRCSTWEQAVVQHRVAVDEVKKKQSKWRLIIEFFS